MTALSEPQRRALATLIYVMTHRLLDVRNELVEVIDPAARPRESGHLFLVLGHLHIVLGTLLLAAADCDGARLGWSKASARVEAIRLLTQSLQGSIERAEPEIEATRTRLACLTERILQNLTTLADASAVLASPEPV